MSIPSGEESKNLLTAAKGGSVSFAGRLFEYGIRFVFGILIARALGVEQFGLYMLASTASLIAANMALLGLQTGLVRFLPPAIREKDEETVRGIIQVCVGLPALFSLCLASALFLLAGPIARLLFHDPRLAPLLRVASLLVPLDTLAIMAYTITISYKQPKYSVIANNVIAPVLKLLLAAAFLAVGLSARGVLVSQVIASLAGLAVLSCYVNMLFSMKRVFGSANRQAKQILVYSFPVYIGWMVSTLRSTLSTLVLGFLGLAAGVGVFTASSRFSMIGSMFYLSVGNISTPIIADLHSQGKSSQMKAYYQTTTRWMVIFNLPIFLTAFLFAKPLLSIFGDDFTSGATSMMIMAFGTLAYTCTGIGANILDMTDHPRVNTANSVLMVIITIALNFFLVPSWGVVGAAVASSLSTILVNVVCLVEVWVLLGMQPYNQNMYKPILAGLVAALAAYLLDCFVTLPSFLLQLIVGGGALWGAYALVLYFLKIAPEDRVVMERLRSRLLPKISFTPRVAQ